MYDCPQDLKYFEIYRNRFSNRLKERPTVQPYPELVMLWTGLPSQWFMVHTTSSISIIQLMSFLLWILYVCIIILEAYGDGAYKHNVPSHVWLGASSAYVLMSEHDTMPGVVTFTPSTAEAMSSKVIHMRTTVVANVWMNTNSESKCNLDGGVIHSRAYGE